MPPRGRRKLIGRKHKGAAKDIQRAASGNDGDDGRHNDGPVTRAARAQADADQRTFAAEKRAAKNFRYAEKVKARKLEAIAAARAKRDDGTPALALTRSGRERASEGAIRTARCRAKTVVVDAIKRSGGNDEQRAEALGAALVDPRVASIAAASGHVPHEQLAKDHAAMNQVRKAMKDAQPTGSGALAKKAEQLITTAAALVATTPQRCQRGQGAGGSEDAHEPGASGSPSGAQESPGVARVAELLELKGQRGLSLAAAGRTLRGANLQSEHRQLLLAEVRRRHRASNISPELIATINKYVLDYDHVIISPIMNDVIFVENDAGEKVRVPKLLLQVPIIQLYTDFMSAHGKTDETDQRPGRYKIGERKFRMRLCIHLR